MIVAAIAQRWGFQPQTGGKVVWFELEAPDAQHSSPNEPETTVI
jgi:hypothetical protein